MGSSCWKGGKDGAEAESEERVTVTGLMAAWEVVEAAIWTGGGRESQLKLWAVGLSAGDGEYHCWQRGQEVRSQTGVC